MNLAIILTIVADAKVFVVYTVNYILDWNDNLANTFHGKTCTDNKYQVLPHAGISQYNRAIKICNLSTKCRLSRITATFYRSSDGCIKLR